MPRNAGGACRICQACPRPGASNPRHHPAKGKESILARHDTVIPEPAPAPKGPDARETLADLAQEAAAGLPEGEGGGLAPEPAPPPAEPGLELTGACVALVAMLGGIMCERFRVAPLSPAEVQGLGGAIAGVAALYLPSDMVDPITARWLALGGAVLAVTMPRIGQRKEVEAAPPIVAPLRPATPPSEPLPPGPIL
jgi:hypothetical protein